MKVNLKAWERKPIFTPFKDNWNKFIPFIKTFWNNKHVSSTIFWDDEHILPQYYEMNVDTSTATSTATNVAISHYNIPNISGV